jgi:GTPase SAR1 family protein
MSLRTKFIVFDGMDNCGKSTLLKDLARDLWPNAKEIKFPKTMPSGALLRMNTEKDFEILFTMFELLDPGKTYLMDRFIVSNLVYDKVLRGEDVALSHHYYAEFKRRFDVMEVFVTRPPIKEAFVDDRIKLTVEQFNAGLDEYKKYGPNYQILLRDVNDNPSTPTSARSLVYDECARFIMHTR